MPELSQQDRNIQIATPLGQDVLLLESFSGTEAISQLFRFHLDLVSTNFTIDFKQIIGKNVTIAVRLPDESFRYINGYISRFSQGQVEGHLARYQAEMVPWLWFLTRTADCRIFQDKPVPDIVEQIFSDLGFTDFKRKLGGSFQKREYCVQYRETDFNFVSRMLEEEGIYYYFEHENGKHTLCLSDKKSGYTACDESPASFASITGPGATHLEGRVYDWNRVQELRPGKYALCDYNFETPNTSLLTNITSTVPLTGISALEIYDYPGDYRVRGDGEDVVKKRMEEEETPFDVSAGSSTCPSFLPGFKFELQDYHRRDQNRGYLLTSVTHSAHSGGFIGGVQSEGSYSNSFTCIPDNVQFRPPRMTAKPVIQGPQTAVVVGRSGEEIYLDKYGRVKVQFHWDREGKYDEKSSCWVRVSQPWAGRNWGADFHPRIGQEVIVEFLEGDPDRPIITGRVHNAENMPPYTLPDEGTKSTIKTLSSKGGGGFNEIRFEDKKGSEQVFIHAEKRHDLRVKADRYEYVGGESHHIVKKKRYEMVEEDYHLHVKADQNEKAGGTISQTAGMDLQQKVGMNYAMEAGMEIHLKAGMTLVAEAGVSLTLKVGGNFININPGGVFISGTMVMINSGGSAGSGSGSSPTAPTDPKEADTAEPGTIPTLPPPKPPPVGTYPTSNQALALRQAAQNGTPFCEKCAAAAAARGL